MFNKLRNSRFVKGLAFYIAVNLMLQICYPTAVYALGGGPSQPEYQSFEPVGASEMVNLSSGDFTYNIPLLDVDGYPINLSYHSGISMDQEASWTGLGWNINPGVISRGMRGLPDDFSGDVVEKEINIRENWTFGVNVSAGVEVLGVDGASGLSSSAGAGVFYNNYKGVGFEFSQGIGFSGPLGLPLSANLGVTANSQEGIDIGADIGLSMTLAKGEHNALSLGVNGGASYSSRGGIRAVNLGSGISYGTTNPNAANGSISYSIGGGSIPIGTQSYVPKISVPTTGFGITFSGSLGNEAFPLYSYGGFNGWYTEQKLATKNINAQAYGYLYAEEGAQNASGLKDFNREKDGVFHTTMHNLPLTNHTYDLYGVSGQGIGGMYRPYRNQVGTVSDPYMTETSSNNSASAEVGFGNFFHAGADYNYVTSSNTSGQWGAGNASNADLQYTANANKNGSESEKSLNEASYFKKVGELSVRDDAYYANIGGTSPLSLDLEQTSTDILGGATLSGVSSANQYRKKREQRNQNLSYLTAEEATAFGLSEKIENNGIGNDISRTEDYRKSHHLSEVTVLREDGVRYVYGIPAYNISQKDVTFNASGNGAPDCDKGLIGYTKDVDNSTDNLNGMDHYYESTTTPAYAHSYLLTAIVSDDYVDITGDGPSEDDLGTYTKFNYAKNDTDYYWRVPLEEDKGIYNRGYRSDSQDDKASYIYGAKEVWYLASVETKTHIAIFSMSDRKDGLGVKGENGGFSSDSRRLKKLDRISLYTRNEWVVRPDGSIPPRIPIKSVFFEYDYSLAKGVLNNCAHPDNGIGCSSNGTQNERSNEGGKLTLKSLYFTYGTSKKGQLNPYEFHYADANHNRVSEPELNPNYDMKGYDRWGTYKPQPNSVSCKNTVPAALSNIGNDEFPYTEQSANTDEYAAAWCLSTIDLPSGGVLNVDYESDDYGYVQDKRAQQMYKVVGTSDGFGGAVSSNSLDQANNFIVVKVPSNTSVDEVIGEENKSKIYFKFLVETIDGNVDYVPGYADYAGAEIHGNTNTNGSTYLYLKVNKETYKDNGGGGNCHPIAKAALQMVRNNLNNIIYPADAKTGFSFKTFSNIFSNYITDAKTLFKGINKTLAGKGIGKSFIANKSFVRLQNIEGNKKGGGVRVKKITMNDAWETMVNSEAGTEYGQTYDYLGEDGMTSGVASYEPLIGGDENPFRKPMSYEVKRSFYDNSVMFQEEPYGESLFPAPSVVYGKVTVKNIDRIDVNDLDGDGDNNELLVNRNATGRTEYEFYTAKDFPIIRKQTGMNKKTIKPKFLNQLFSKSHTYRFGASQGYSIELNDMHGKPKAKRTFAEGGIAQVEGIEYNYQHKGDRLNNEVSVINAKNQISKKVIGEEIDVVMDSRRQESTTTGETYQGGVDQFFISALPVFIPHLWNLSSNTLREFKSSVSTKVIQRYGVLEEVVVYDQNSKVSTKNKLYDEATGNVLLTETKNEFDDNLYAFNYPAHWVYEGMEQASRNIGANIPIVSNGLGVITSSTDNLTRGDELINGNTKVWVSRDQSTGELILIDQSGYLVTNLNATLKILRSGKRNLHSLSVGDIVSRSPIINSAGTAIAPGDVLNTNAIEYNDVWAANKEECTGENVTGSDGIVNPYVKGLRGNYKAYKSYAYNKHRNQLASNDIRKDGSVNIVPFWGYATSNQSWHAVQNVNHPQYNGGISATFWILNSQVTKTNPRGNQLESRDALQRYSAAQYGYNSTRVIAEVFNARYNHFGFQGFEDYEYYSNPCATKHFEWGSNNKVSSEEAHTGTVSYRLFPSESLAEEWDITASISGTVIESGPYVLASRDDNGIFKPIKGEKYVLSAWIKEQNSPPEILAYTNPELQVLGSNSASVTTLDIKKSNIIDGWQKVEITFEITSSAVFGDKLIVQLDNSGNNNVFIDDIRIQPFNSTMNSYVYDPRFLRLWAELDDRNYATFYEYDEEGTLVRVKKETERGIKTIQENRAGVKK